MFYWNAFSSDRDVRWDANGGQRDVDNKRREKQNSQFTMAKNVSLWLVFSPFESQQTMGNEPKNDNIRERTTKDEGEGALEFFNKRIQR